METIHASKTHLEVFVAGKEFFVLLRPRGMLASSVASMDPHSADILVKKVDAAGAIFRFSADCAAVIIRGQPQHACDDRLRYVLAKWFENLS